MLAPALIALTLAVSPAATGIETFRTPSRNIACLYAPASAGAPAMLRCDILTGLRPEPRNACRLDWTGLGLGLTGRARPTCAGDTTYDSRSPILAYGRTWMRGGITCLSRRVGLRCTNRARHGFELARERWRTF